MKRGKKTKKQSILILTPTSMTRKKKKKKDDPDRSQKISNPEDPVEASLKPDVASPNPIFAEFGKYIKSLILIASSFPFFRLLFSDK